MDDNNDEFTVDASGFWSDFGFAILMVVVLFVLFMLSGCATLTSMDWNRAPPSDWPKLTVNVHDVTTAEVLDKCGKDRFSFGATPNGCALVFFSSRRCEVYLISREPELVRHETGHCRGYDHPGESEMHNAWARYKAKGGV